VKVLDYKKVVIAVIIIRQLCLEKISGYGESIYKKIKNIKKKDFKIVLQEESLAC